jgi:hypothetical protein
MANNNNTWNVNNDEEIPANLYVSPPSSPMSVASNVGSMATLTGRNLANAKHSAKFKQNFNRRWAIEHPSDPVHVNEYVPLTKKTNNTYANMIAKWKARNTSKNKKYKTRAEYNANDRAELSAAVSPVAEAPSSNFSFSNFYTPALARLNPATQGRVYGPELQTVMAKAFSKAASAAAARGATYEEEQAAGRAAAQYAEVMKIRELNKNGQPHYPGVEAEAANREEAAYKAKAAAKEAAAAAKAANIQKPVTHWPTPKTAYPAGKGKRRNTRKNRRSERKSRRNGRK